MSPRESFREIQLISKVLVTEQESTSEHQMFHICKPCNNYRQSGIRTILIIFVKSMYHHDNN